MRTCHPPIRPEENEETEELPDLCPSDSDGGGEDARQHRPEEEAAARGKEAEVANEEMLCQECHEVPGIDKAVRDPGTPTPLQRATHELNHWPYRSWCEPCVNGRATGQPHRGVKGEWATSDVTRVLMDYGFLHEEETTTEEEHGKEIQAKVSMTMMVMMETLCESVWSYAIDGKGATSLEWLAAKVVEDIETVGLSKERIITKTDQEPAIVQLQREVARLRTEAGTALENSKVGDSDSNGKIERAIREVKGLIRTLRSALEAKTGEPIKLDAPIVPWIVRHAAYVLTRCRILPDGRTAMQKMKGRKVNVPWVPFGETVLFKLPKVPNMPGDFADRFERGVWVGCTIRSGEHLVGTDKGVFKVSSVIRRSEDERWSRELVNGMKGSPKEPVPGSGSSRVVAYSKHRDEEAKRQVEFAPRQIGEEPEVRQIYIYKKDVEKIGATEGCPGCRAIMTPGSKFRAKHTPECRRRMEEELSKTEEGKRRVERVNEKLTQAIVDKSSEFMSKDTDDADRHPPTKNSGIKASESSGQASGSGITEEERNAGRLAAKKKEAESEDINMGITKNDDEDFGTHGHEAPNTPKGRPEDIQVPMSPGPGSAKAVKDETMVDRQEELEEAPQRREDIRVPLGPREPAQKRERGEASPPKSAKWQAYERDDAPTDSVSSHPSPVVKKHEICPGDLRWKNIGSGTVARTFKDAKKLSVTTKGGPPTCDVHRRIVRNLNNGKVMDDCIIDDTPDEELFRELEYETDIRVELILKNALEFYQRKGADVVEIYSQPRITQEAAVRRYDGASLVPGWSLDLTRNDPRTGKAWDLSDKKVQSRVERMIKEGKPLFVIGSPPCTAMSTMQNLNKDRRDPKVVAAERREAEEHVRFCIRIYKIQMEGHRCFVHEHPSGASSWQMKEMVELMACSDVDVAKVDMCQFGMTAVTKEGEGPVRKRTKIISNSKEVLKKVEKKCPNDGGPGAHHEHVHLVDGRAKQAQVYPRAFCRAVCEGVAAEKRIRALGVKAKPMLSMEEMQQIAHISGAKAKDGESASDALHEEEVDEGKWTIAVDDQTGEPLCPKMVRIARKEEIAYFKERDVYEKVKLSECWEATGKNPIGVKWVDINKGDKTNPYYRSRLVAMEFKTNERPEWYAATPPSECLKLMLHKMAMSRRAKLMYADVSRAYFYAKASRPVYVKIPAEDWEEGDEERCGKLKVSMYGTRDAAMNWALEYGDTLKAAGFKQGVTSPCLFRHEENGVVVMVHGDDFVAVGEAQYLKATKKALEDKYKIKVETLGSDKGDAKEIRVLNKVIRLTEQGLELEADPRHAELVVRALGLEAAKPSPTPGTKATKKSTVRDKLQNDAEAEGEEEDEEGAGDEEEGPEELAQGEAKEYRAIVARLNYIASDRPDIQFAVKEAARNMATPRREHWPAVKRIGKYLKGRPRLVMKYEWQKPLGTVVTYTDSDWAGCSKTGKSTSGGIVTIGGHMIKSYSRQQRTVALSSAEAELHAMVAASAETLGVIGLCKDMGIAMEGEVYTDSSAALGITQRLGNGKVRHLRVQALWVQEVRCTRRLGYKKVLGSRNPADILTKHVPKDLLNVHLATLGIEFQDGRAESAPTLDNVEAYTEEWYEEEEEEDDGERKAQKVRFDRFVQVRTIPACGRGRPTKWARKTKARMRRRNDETKEETKEETKDGRIEGGVEACKGQKPRWADMADEE